MNQYINEQALLYINELKNKETKQTDEGHPHHIAQKSKSHLMRRSGWPRVLIGLFNLVRGKRASSIVIKRVRSSQRSS